MIYLLAGLAFFIAMAALFLAGDATRKADRHTQDFLAKHVRPIKDSSDKSVATVRDLQSLIKKLKVEVEAIRTTQNETLEHMTRQDDEIRKTRAELAKLDR